MRPKERGETTGKDDCTYLPSKELKRFREEANQELKAFLRGARRPKYANQH